MSTPVKPIAKPRPGAARPATGASPTPQKPARRSTTARRFILGEVTGVPSGDRTKMLANIRKGLPFKVIEVLEEAYGAPRKDIAEVLSIPITTLQRRRKAGRLEVDESDRVARFARLKDAALDLMQGDDQAAIQWLHTPLELLGGESPMLHASTDLGARDVEDLIGRIRHGVFS